MNASRRAGFQPIGWVFAIATTGLVVGLHIYFWIHAGGLWRDEVNLINLAKLDSLSAMARDSFPVLMPLLVKALIWLGPGQSDAGLRFLGLIIGLGLPAALWLAAWKFHRQPPLIGLALLALNGTVIVFGDSLRAHGLGSLLILLTAVAMGWLLLAPDWRRTFAAAALAVLSVQTLFHNAIFIAALCLGAWAVCGRRKDLQTAGKILCIGLIAAISLLPYLQNFLALSGGAASLRTGLQWERVWAMIATAFGFPMDQCRWLWLVLALGLLGGAAGKQFPRWPKIQSKFPGQWTLLVMTMISATGFLWFATAPAKLWWIFPLLAIAAMWLDRNEAPAKQPATAISARDPSDDLALFSGVTVLAAGAGFAGFLGYCALPTEQWYFIPLMALAAGCFEIGLPVRGHRRALAAGFAVVVVGAACVVIFVDKRAVNWRFTNVDLLCPRLVGESGPGDLVLVSPWYCGMTFQRYFRGTAQWETLPPIEDHSLARYDLVHEQMKKPQAIAPLLARAETALRAGHRVWLVGMMSVPEPGAAPPPDLPPPPLPASGWSDRPYTYNWLLQVNQFLANHSREFKLAQETPAGNLHFMENLQVYRVEGWRD